MCYATLGAVGWVFIFYFSTRPTIPDDFGAASPVTSLASLAAIVLLVPWAVLPIPLLIGGLVHLRSARPAAAQLNRRRQLTWVAAILGCAALEWSIVAGYTPRPIAMSPGYAGPPVPDWAALAESAAFMVIGVVMIIILVGPVARQRRRGGQAISW